MEKKKTHGPLPFSQPSPASLSACLARSGPAPASARPRLSLTRGPASGPALPARPSRSPACAYSPPRSARVAPRRAVHPLPRWARTSGAPSTSRNARPSPRRDLRATSALDPHAEAGLPFLNKPWPSPAPHLPTQPPS